MAFSFAALKAKTRRVVHDTLAVDAFYQDNSMSAPQPIRARWHNKTDRFGDLMDQGYAEVVQGADRVMVFPCDYPTLNFVRGGVVTFPEYRRAFRLDVLEPSDGPHAAIWQAVSV